MIVILIICYQGYTFINDFETNECIDPKSIDIKVGMSEKDMIPTTTLQSLFISS